MQTENRIKKKPYLELVRLLVTAAAILFLAAMMKRNGVSFGYLLQLLKSARRPYLLAAFLLNLALLVPLAQRLQLMFRAQGIRMPLRDLVSLTFVGTFFNNFLPSSIGGDAAKIFYASRRTRQGPVCFTCVFADRMIGLVSMVMIAGLALLFSGKLLRLRSVVWAVIAMIALAVFVILFLVDRNLARRFRFLLPLLRLVKLDRLSRTIYDLVNSYRKHPGIVLAAFAYSFVLQSVWIFVNFLVARSLSLSLPTVVFFLFVPVVGAISLIPSFGGLGVREGGYVLLFGALILPEQALALSLLLLVVVIGQSLVGGLIYVVDPYYRSTER